MMEEDNDIHPVLTPVRLGGDASSEFGVWFILKDILGEPRDHEESKGKESTFSRFKTKFKDSLPNYGYGSHGDLEVVPITMHESEYHDHFGFDPHTGQWSDRVTPPKGGRLAFVKERYEKQQPKARKIR